MKLDIGCGPNKLEGYVGVDIIPFDGKVDWVGDMREDLWVFNSKVKPELEGINHWVNESTEGNFRFSLEDDCVDEVHSSHFLEHLTGAERIFFFNELFRVMKPGAQARFITPSWSHERAYGDPTHQWPPVCGWTFFYLFKPWRDLNAPHVGYTCDFDYALAGTHDPNDSHVAFRNMETKLQMMSRNINTTTDLIANLTKRKPA